jgi:AcrR family transcriptional regulator
MSTETRAYEQRVRADRRRETTRRIVEATLQLHREVGPARTTVAEIARRARVSRLTVYQHFPDEAELFAACQRLFMDRNPRRGLESALELDDAEDRIRTVLTRLYRWYGRAAPVTEKIQRDRLAIPALDALMRRTSDAQLDRTADLLVSGMDDDGGRPDRGRVVARLALDFWTWKRLRAEDLDDREAAELMTEAVLRAAG